MKAYHSDLVIDTIGVNVHGTYLDTQYGDTAQVCRTLSYLGIRHVRDGSFSWGVEQARAMADAGCKLTLNALSNDDLTQAALSTQIGRLCQLGDAIDTITGPNERDIYADLEAREWVNDLADATPRIYNAVLNARPELAGAKVAAPALAFPDAMQSLTGLAAMTAVDVADAHAYPGGRPPEANIADVIAQANRTYPDRRLIVTETGYHDAIAATTAGHRAVNETVAATYYPRLFLEYFRLGIARTFAYELARSVPGTLDPANPEQHFALVRDDWTLKPAARALRYLNRLLADPGPHPAFPDVDLKITAGVDYRSILLARSDGAHLLALWRPVSVWDEQTYKPRTVGTAHITLKLPKGLNVTRLHRPSSLTSRDTDDPVIPVDAELTLVEID